MPKKTATDRRIQKTDTRPGNEARRIEDTRARNWTVLLHQYQQHANMLHQCQQHVNMLHQRQQHANKMAIFLRIDLKKCCQSLDMIPSQLHPTPILTTYFIIIPLIVSRCFRMQLSQQFPDNFFLHISCLPSEMHVRSVLMPSISLRQQH